MMSLLGSRGSISETYDWRLRAYKDMLASGLKLVDHVPTRAVYSYKSLEGEERHLTHWYTIKTNIHTRSQLIISWFISLA